MKLAILISTMAIILVESQFYFPNYYHPRLLNPMLLGNAKYIGYPYELADEPRNIWFVPGQRNRDLVRSLACLPYDARLICVL